MKTLKSSKNLANDLNKKNCKKSINKKQNKQYLYLKSINAASCL